MATLTIILPDEEFEFVERATKRHGVDVAGYVRRVIADTHTLFSR